MLHGVAAVVEHRHVGLAGGAGEADRQLLHLRLAEVGAEDHLEIAPAQRRRDVLGVVGRVGQHRLIGVGAVADHQRDPRLGPRRPVTEPAGQQREADSEKCAHQYPRNIPPD